MKYKRNNSYGYYSSNSAGRVIPAQRSSIKPLKSGVSSFRSAESGRTSLLNAKNLLLVALGLVSALAYRTYSDLTVPKLSDTALSLIGDLDDIDLGGSPDEDISTISESGLARASLAPNSFSLSSKDLNSEQLIPAYLPSGIPQFASLRSLRSLAGSQESSLNISLTVNESLEKSLRAKMSSLDLDMASVVMLRPETGEVMAMVSTDDFSSEQPLALQATFPAASLFKIVTAAASIELGGVKANTEIFYRGGNTKLNKGNYQPNASLDSRKTTLSQAMSKSNNPAFARLALTQAGGGSLEDYARGFGIGELTTFEVPVGQGSFPVIEDDYQLARVGAGFGEVLISPLRAALVAQTLANDGVLMQPWIIRDIRTGSGERIHLGSAREVGRAILPSTAKEIEKTMRGTIKSGTARKPFRGKDWSMAAKTGTLSGTKPKGRYHWFIANFPAEKPEISLATLVIDQGGARINGSGLARHAIDVYTRLK